MTYDDAVEIIDAIKTDLKCSLEHDLYTILDTEFSGEVLEALNVLGIPS